ncbi:helix-turn-helix domain-containing protein [Streptomyces cacaoi]|uniref:helix-turn-helix domain-containing protein n=1 Tax=Streptomyces cacaoi TaxID=1898 RepID=UPI0027A786EC|nr:helix-turn-helix transcriptional regulator [Streptomyces cacaoi]
MAIVVDLDVQLARHGLSVGAFAAAVGITPANIAVLKNGRAKAIRFTTLDAICRTLDCQPGDILRWVPDDPQAPDGSAGPGHPGGPGSPGGTNGARGGTA